MSFGSGSAGLRSAFLRRRSGAGELDAHLRGCADCRRKFDQEIRRLELVESTLGRIAARVPSEDFEARLLSRLVAESVCLRSRWTTSLPIGVGALAAALLMAIWLIAPTRQHSPVVNSRFKIQSSTLHKPMSNRALGVMTAAHRNERSKVQNSRLDQGMSTRAPGIMVTARFNPKSKVQNPKFRGPDLRVIVEKGEWNAVVQLYEAARSGRVNTAALLAKDAGPITIKPIEISELKIAPIGGGGLGSGG